MKASFQINFYDSDGDIVEECLLLHLSDDNNNKMAILPLRDIQELDKFIERLQGLSNEIHSNF